MQRFKHQNREYEVKIGYLEAMEKLPAMGVHPLNLVSDQQKTQDTLLTVLLDDEKCLSLMFHYLSKDSDVTWEQFLERLVPNELNDFKEAFWEELLNFSGPLKRNTLTELRKEVKRELRNPSLDKSPSESSPEES